MRVIDKVKQMTAGELAHILEDGCPYPFEECRRKGDGDCHECFVEWLESEYEANT